MNILLLLIISIFFFACAYFVYGGYISRAIGVNPSRKIPAADETNPASTPLLLGHHFAAIAGAGPIVGPIIALFFGYIPVWLWILLGAVFIGAVHDYTSLFVSVREGGRSMAEVVSRTLGKTGFILFILFTITMTVLVTSAYLGLTAKALSSVVPLSMLRLGADQMLLKTEFLNETLSAQIGGIAGTSVIIMILSAPLIGFLLNRLKTKTFLVGIVSIVIAIASIVAGFFYPLSLNFSAWMFILAVYMLLSAEIPVSFVLRPLDFMSINIFFCGLTIILISIISAGIKGVVISLPAFNLSYASTYMNLGYVFPILFVTVACGAISGFHSLISGGAAAQKIRGEKETLPIGYGSMLLEGLLAVCVIIAVGAGLKFSEYQALVFPPDIYQSNPILAFSIGAGNLIKYGLNIPTAFGAIFGILLVEGFVVTSLYSAIRLNCYLFLELWKALIKNPHPLLKSYYVNSGLAILLMFSLGASNAYITIWPIFGTANQLLAVLTLISISAWLLIRRKPIWFTIIPAIFMLITAFTALMFLLFQKYIPSGNYPLIIADLLLLAFSAALTAEIEEIFTKHLREKRGEILEFEKEEEELEDEFHLG